MQDEITELLKEWEAGEPDALSRMVPLVEAELRLLAHHHFQQEAPDHTLQPTALVNELYLRLSSQINVRFINRSQFFAFASRLMRRILVDHHRARHSAKRGMDHPRISFDDALGVAEIGAAEILLVDDALESLKTVDPQLCRVVELRFFGGLTVQETAEALGISPATVKREWAAAKAFLSREMKPS